MKAPTQAQIYAALRYAGTAVGTLGTIAALLGVMDATTAHNIVLAAQALVQDLTQTFTDASKLILLLAPVLAVWCARVGIKSASPRSQIAAVESLDAAHVVVTDPALAKDIPGVEVKAK